MISLNIDYLKKKYRYNGEPIGNFRTEDFQSMLSFAYDDTGFKTF